MNDSQKVFGESERLLAKALAAIREGTWQWTATPGVEGHPEARCFRGVAGTMRIELIGSDQGARGILTEGILVVVPPSESEEFFTDAQAFTAKASPAESSRTPEAAPPPGQ
jgi:hypothetical protein